MLGESDLTHSDLLRGHNQYVGRSLKVNGPFYRDTYTSCAHIIGQNHLPGRGKSSISRRNGYYSRCIYLVSKRP
ncbi:hypothetical protein FML26_28405 [Klebsiella michiganensis]|nr:hypothetical protein [Klebsiella grimontii]MBZ7680925.1 hypothetical protein [Klebsiella michiganensis]RVS12983.1 hypothetical protein EOL18_27630 [Raoultella ornithinolytica]TXU88688.1 hypothetical protein D4M90_27655 [Klebsiella oxytoca]TYE39649.1 hypothetical protein DJ508_29930 [Klebsiella michiganensis]